MIDALGINNLTNQVHGKYYGSSLTWSKKQKQTVGAGMLVKAFYILLQEGENQLLPGDLRCKTKP